MDTTNDTTTQAADATEAGRLEVMRAVDQSIGRRDILQRQALGDLIGVVNDLYNIMLITDAAQEIEQESPASWHAAFELLPSGTSPAGTVVETLGAALALRAILRSPDVLLFAVKRLSRQIGALIDAEALVGDVETVATILPACVALMDEPLPDDR